MTFGQRSVLALLLRAPLRFMFATALLLSISAILLSGQIPPGATVPGAADPPPHDAVLAAGGMLAIGTATFIFGSTVVLALMTTQTTSSDKFMKWLVWDAERCVGGPADHHVSIARQTLTLAARAQDGRAVYRALEAITVLVRDAAQRAAASPGLPDGSDDPIAGSTKRAGR